MKKLLTALLALSFFVFPYPTAAQGTPPYQINLPFIVGGEGECTMTKAEVLRQINAQGLGAGEFWDDSTFDPSDDDAPPVPEGVTLQAVVDGILIKVDFSTDKAHVFPRFQEFIVYARPLYSDIEDTTAVEVCRFSGSTKVWQQPHGGYRGWEIALSAVTNNEVESGKTAFYPITISTLYDNFSGYGGDTLSSLEGLNWLQVKRFEDLSEWTSYDHASIDTTYVKEGTGSAKLSLTGADWPAPAYLIDSTLHDYSQEKRFTDDDYFCISLYVESIGGTSAVLIFYFETSGTADSYSTTLDIDADYPVGWHHVAIKRSDFTVNGNPNWNSVSLMMLMSMGNTGTTTIYLDDARMVKASPSDATTFSDTGDAWTPVGTAIQHVYQGDRSGEPPGFSLGHLGAGDSTWNFSIARQVGVPNGKMSERMRFHGANGKAGLGVRCDADGSECLGVILDSAADTIWLVQWRDGGDPATTNMALNPSAEAAGNFGNQGSATTTADATYALFGVKAFKVVTTAAAGDGMTATLSALSNADHYVTFYVYATGDPGETLLQVSADNTNWNAVQFLEGKLGWSRYEAFIPAAQANGSTTIRIKQTDATARTFYIDGILTTTVADAAYVDGSLGLHYTWSGTANASTSSRPVNTPITVASASYPISALGVDYYVGVDFRDDANEGRIKVTVSADAASLWSAAALKISAKTLSPWPVETGLALISFDCNCRFGEVRGGSPQTADYAHTAGVANVALVAVTFSATEPTAPWAGMLWVDTATPALCIRDAANSAWLTVGLT